MEELEHVIFALILVAAGGFILLNIRLKSSKSYPGTNHHKFSLGRITDQKGFNRWSRITGSYLAGFLIFLGVLMSLFPAQLGVLIIMLSIIIAGFLAVYIFGGMRYTK